MLRTCFTLASLLTCGTLHAQTRWPPATDEQPTAPPREFRAAWVASVANIDWPSARTLTTEQQAAEIRTITDAAAKAGLNALLVQVRPTADALYSSELEPWSEFLTGSQGKAPDPLYDPLAVWIEECRGHALQCHAWFNPFRTRHFEAKGPDAANHVNKAHPELVHEYDRYTWMDPGEQESQDIAMRAIMDVVRRYDIDGVHIDDYFYPYPKAGQEFPDDASWNRYGKGGGTLSRQDWRRDNINRFVKRMYEEVKAAKPHVRVGISPFGIWRPGNPAGVEGYDAYEKLCGDAKLWLNEGWMDYASPQLYWKVDAPKQPFQPLLDWWITQSRQGRPVYPGLNASRCDPAEGKWPASEIVKQIELARATTGAGGAVMFSVKALTKNYSGLADALAAGPYAAPALVPVCDTCGDAPPPALRAECRAEPDGRIAISWDVPSGEGVLVTAWKKGGAWTFKAIAVQAGGIDHEACDAAALAILSRSGTLSPWLVWRGPR